jgi:hypothetical protein
MEKKDPAGDKKPQRLARAAFVAGLSSLPDTIDCLFVRWMPEALRCLIRALCRLVRSDYSRRSEIFFYPANGQPLPFPVPPLGDGDCWTETWPQTLCRFGQASDTLISQAGQRGPVPLFWG